MLSDVEIKNFIEAGHLKINPIFEDSIRENGVDLRFGGEFCVLKETEKVLDTRLRRDIHDFYKCYNTNTFVIQPNSRVLATTMEYLELPPYISGEVNLRSSFARMGLLVPPTVVDAGFRGELTIEILGSSFPIKVYRGQRFLHLTLYLLQQPTSKPYRGKYSSQRGVKLPVLPV